ncbi:MAG: hypothetical protein Q8M20_13620 [Rhodocyclaceae bacterium]|nr:hypothetical protein [Rhodocyclaceae bacterium]MDZ4216038.1 hypothetical protein [Rhodocyclaceae bacterium]
MNDAENDGRLSFQEAVTLATQKQQATFCAMPVFSEAIEDEAQTAEGARIFIIEPNADKGPGNWLMRFIAGPFFSNAYAANERIEPADVPDSVRELRFMPTRVDSKWYEEQIQILIQHLVKGAGIATEQMPDYASMPARSADSETVFPISFIGRGEAPH